MEMFDHIMVDLETLGTESNSVIMSIAAVPFNMESGKTGTPYYTNVDIQSCLNVGLQISGSTLEWWMKQSNAAITRIFSGTSLPLDRALDELSGVISQFYDIQVWGNSARFDLGILENAYLKSGKSIPWKFYNERDVRTLVAFDPDVKANMVFTGTPHDALDDCLHQVKYCSAIWNGSLKKKKA
jgi:hypothetical protein